MEKKMKKAIMATMIVTAIYAMYLWVVQSSNGLQSETTITFFSASWLQLTLSFSVSHWWNLLISPLTIMTLAYFFSQEAIVGKEPRGVKEETGYKYYTRLHVFIVNCLSFVMAVGLMIMAAFISPIYEESNLGPLSALVSAVITWFICYIGFAICIEAAMCLFTWNTFADDGYQIEGTNLVDRYQVTLSTFVKMGIVKTTPFTLGLTIGLLLRITLSKIFSFLKPIKISYSKETQKM